MPELGVGSSVGNYVLESHLGDGGFGTVWLAHTIGSKEPVAIKLLTGASAGGSAITRAEVELLAASAGSRSRHVVKVLDGGVEPTPYVVMEYVEGHDLSRLLHDHGALTVTRTIDVGEAIADALAALNEVGIMHRDVKPANVLIDQTGNIKLGDFGIAKIIGYSTVTVGGSSALTLAYAAPEIWDDGTGEYGFPSHKSDLYALGILLYECLVGVTPYQGNFGALYSAHRAQNPDLTKLPPDTPASLTSLIKRSLAKRPAERPHDAGECLAMLERARVEVREASGDPPMNEPKRFGNWRRGVPHRMIPWAWECTDDTGRTATVEVHFAHDLQYGIHLRNAVAANLDLTPLGAERLIDTNRLILRPTETWTPDPREPFTFWIARHELPRESVTQLTLSEAQTAAIALHSMIEAAKKDGLALSLSPEQISTQPGGHIILHRPGLDPDSEDPEGDALTILRGLPLDPAARVLFSKAKSLAEVIMEDKTVIVWPEVVDTVITRRLEVKHPSYRTCSNCQASLDEGQLFCNNCGFKVAIVAEELCPRCRNAIGSGAAFCPYCGERVPPESSATTGSLASKPDGFNAVSVGLRSLDGNNGNYELIVNNTGTTTMTVYLSGRDASGHLYFEHPQDLIVGPGIIRRVPVRVLTDWDGWPRKGAVTPFSMYIDGASKEESHRVDGELFVQGAASPISNNQTIFMYVACAALGLAIGLGFVLFVLR